MNDQDMDRLLAGHYRNRALGTDRLGALLSQITRESPRRPAAWAWRAALSYAAAPAVAVLLAGAFALLRHAQPGLRPSSAAAHEAAREVAYNHRKAFTAQFEGGPAALSASMTELGFALLDSARVRALDAAWTGGRYCSLGGAKAAQMRLSRRDGSVFTHYQAPATGALSRVPDSIWELDGVRVRLWREEGLLLALAEASPRGGAPAD